MYFASPMHLPIWIFCLISINAKWANCASSYRNEVAANGVKGYPGIQVSLSPKGIKYFESVAETAVDEVVPHLKLPDMILKVILGNIILTEMHVSDYTPAKTRSFEMQKPNLIDWSLNHMKMTVTGHSRLDFRSLQDEGDFYISSDDANIEVTLVITGDNGRPKLTMKSCESEINDMDMKLLGFSKQVTKLVSNHKKLVLNIAKKKIEKELCKQLTSYVDGELNADLQQMSMKMPMNHQSYSILDGTPFSDGSSSSSSSTKLVWADGQAFSKTEQQMVGGILSKMMLDYSMTDDPEFSKNYANIYADGEISYNGESGTPFYPVDLGDSATASTSSDKMILVTVSDYTVNSLLYQAYSKGLMNFKLNKIDNPDFASLFKPKCSEIFGEICLNSAIPEITQQYPDALIELQLKPTQAPAIIMRNDGKATAYIDAELKILAKKGQSVTEILKATVSSESDLAIQWVNNAIKANATIKKINVKLVSTTLQGMNQKRLDDVSGAGKTIIEYLINAEISKGYPVPSISEFRLINPKLKLLDRKCQLETDIQVENAPIVKFARRVVATMARRKQSDSGNSNNSKKNKSSKKDDKSSKTEKNKKKRNKKNKQ